MPTPAVRPEWSLSIVSHGHLPRIRELVEDLRRCVELPVTELILTLNLPEDETGLSTLWAGPLRVIRNPSPRGFSANHNAALRDATGRYVAMLDPDLRMAASPLPALAAALRDPQCGIAAAVVLDEHARVADHARAIPTLGRLLMRRLHPEPAPYDKALSGPLDVDWVAGLFMAMQAETFHQLRGFDERFHMYCEDVDLCLRCWNAGLAVRVVPTPPLVHPARRQTLKRWQHFVWHCRSLIRLRSSKAYRNFVRRT